jgi:hypothetical protein
VFDQSGPKTAFPYLWNLWSGDEGQALVEYAMILPLVSIVGFVLLQAIGLDIVQKLALVKDAFP